MLTAIGMYPNLSFGLPVQPNAKRVTVTWKATSKVTFSIRSTNSVTTKQIPK